MPKVRFPAARGLQPGTKLPSFSCRKDYSSVEDHFKSRGNRRRGSCLQPIREVREEDLSDILESIKACGRLHDLSRGYKIHADILRTGLLKRNIYVGTALLHMYAKCGALAKAQEVFDEFPTKDIVSWTALICGYAQHELGDEALRCFERMQAEGISPNAITFASILRACANIGALGKGEEIHAEVSRRGLLKNDIALGNALVDMYGKCGELSKAQEAFDKLPQRNSISWNALIYGYAYHGYGEKALRCFMQMRDEGYVPSKVTFVCIFRACGSIGAIEKGKEIHAEVGRQGLLENDIVLGNVLLDMYVKCGAFADAQEVFDELPTRNVISWTSLIAGYAENGLGDEALKCFELMQGEGFSPNAITFISVFKACGTIGAAEKGEEMHVKLHDVVLWQDYITLGPALVDMYAKCAMLAKAQEVFENLPSQNVLSWTALMSGYAHFGKVEKVLNFFNKMTEYTEPNKVTFIILLTACSHAGLLEEGQMHFDSMGISNLQQHACMVDLFSRAGNFEKAISLMKRVPYSNSGLGFWTAMLAACKKWMNVELAKWAFDHARSAESGSSYILFADVLTQDEVDG